MKKYSATESHSTERAADDLESVELLAITAQTELPVKARNGSKSMKDKPTR